jgi:N-acetylglucosaminyldiphosphoundecaprenol N-acetyl-beta-D-mannosaminyltransferase
MTVPWPAKAPVVGTPISLTSYDEILSLVGARPAGRAMVIVVCNVHSVMSARRDPGLARALGRAEVATPDGMPLVWALQVIADRRQSRVYGPELMRRALVHGADRGWRHFLFGTTPATLDRLRAAAKTIAPGVRIVGEHAPPFRPLTPEEEEAILSQIRASGADIVWVGLGMPKQELWMDRVRDRLPGVTLAGVGAAFDLLSGTVPQAPTWMQRAGLEWLYRLAQEPRRLWRRYLWNNPAYLVLLAAQLVFGRGGRRPGD